MTAQLVSPSGAAHISSTGIHRETEGRAIGTSSADVAHTALAALKASGVFFAILHGEQELAGGHCDSDVDIVTRHSAREVLRMVARALRAQRLHPVLIWPYDINSASVFIVDEDVQRGVQFDMLFDREGLGRYGVRSETILQDVVDGHVWPSASPLHETLYLVRKAMCKQQRQRMDRQLDALRQYPKHEVRANITRLFVGDAADAMLAAVRGEAPQRHSRHVSKRVALTAVRYAARVARPVGFWVAVKGANSNVRAAQIAERFEPILPVVESVADDAASGSTLARLRQIAAVRWRAGVVATSGRDIGIVKPDLILRNDNGSHARDLNTIVRAMEDRLHL